MLNTFQTYQLALKLRLTIDQHQILSQIPYRLRDQLLRASESVVLNIAEGSGRPTKRDQKRFYGIALGSAREVFAVLEIVQLKDPILTDLLDHLSVCLYKVTFR